MDGLRKQYLGAANEMRQRSWGGVDCMGLFMVEPSLPWQTWAFLAAM
jgi:hypothetical protein